MICELSKCIVTYRVDWYIRDIGRESKFFISCLLAVCISHLQRHSVFLPEAGFTTKKDRPNRTLPGVGRIQQPHSQLHRLESIFTVLLQKHNQLLAD